MNASMSPRFQAACCISITDCTPCAASSLCLVQAVNRKSDKTKEATGHRIAAFYCSEAEVKSHVDDPHKTIPPFAGVVVLAVDRASADEDHDTQRAIWLQHRGRLFARELRAVCRLLEEAGSRIRSIDVGGNR